MEYLLGVVVSLLVEGIKRFTSADSFTTHLILLTASLAGSAAYVLLSTTDIWPVLVQIVLTASAFHNLVIRKFTN